MKVGLIALLLFSSVPVNAHESQRGYTTKRTCYKETYREEYVAGTRESKGYVKSLLDKVKVLVIHQRRFSTTTAQNFIQLLENSLLPPKTTYRVSSSNSSSSTCRSSRATGEVLTGSLAAALFKKDAWGWTILLGEVIGLGVSDANC